MNIDGIAAAILLLVLLFAVNLSFSKPEPKVQPRRRLRSPAAEMTFKDGHSLFRYWCKFGDTSIREGVGIVAIVLNRNEVDRINPSSKGNIYHNSTILVKVASSDGGFIVPSLTPYAIKVPLMPGDIVSWVPGNHLARFADYFGDRRRAWVGLVMAKLELRISTTGIVIAEMYD